MARRRSKCILAKQKWRNLHVLCTHSFIDALWICFSNNKFEKAIVELICRFLLNLCNFKLPNCFKTVVCYRVRIRNNQNWHIFVVAEDELLKELFITKFVFHRDLLMLHLRAWLCALADNWQLFLSMQGSKDN